MCCAFFLDLVEFALWNSWPKIKNFKHDFFSLTDVKDTESFPDLQQQIASVVGDCGLNLLINNAGIMYPDSLDKVTKETMMDNFEVNAVSPLLLTKVSFLKNKYKLHS